LVVVEEQQNIPIKQITQANSYRLTVPQYYGPVYQQGHRVYKAFREPKAIQGRLEPKAIQGRLEPKAIQGRLGHKESVLSYREL
jgi:hypothetical protein